MMHKNQIVNRVEEEAAVYVQLQRMGGQDALSIPSNTAVSNTAVSNTAVSNTVGKRGWHKMDGNIGVT
jgi:hypothetical protein